MRNRKSPWILLLTLLTGALIGGIAGELLFGYSGFGWIGLGGANGYRELFAFTLNPLVDTHFIRLGVDIALRINAGSLLGMILGIIVYARL
jgi:hypothetical protein